MLAESIKYLIRQGQAQGRTRAAKLAGGRGVLEEGGRYLIDEAEDDSCKGEKRMNRGVRDRQMQSMELSRRNRCEFCCKIGGARTRARFG